MSVDDPHNVQHVTCTGCGRTGAPAHDWHRFVQQRAIPGTPDPGWHCADCHAWRTKLDRGDYEPAPLNLYEKLAPIAEEHGADAILRALADACESALDGCASAVVGRAALSFANRDMRAAAANVERAERGTGVTLAMALHVLGETISDTVAEGERLMSEQVMGAEPRDIECPDCAAAIGKDCADVLGVAFDRCHEGRVRQRRIEAAIEHKVALYSIDDEHETTLYALLAENADSPLDPEEIAAIRDLEIGHALTLGGGAVAEMVIRRVA